MTVFKFSTSVIQERYNYFPEEHGLKRRFIWGEYIDSDLNTTQEHLHEIALKGKQLLAKMTGNRIEFYYPELHCRNCQTLNQFEASICEACNQEINRITPNALALD